jgi:hypothetical protein
VLEVVVDGVVDPLEVAELAGVAVVVDDAGSVFAGVEDSDFDPRLSVL